MEPSVVISRQPQRCFRQLHKENVNTRLDRVELVEYVDRCMVGSKIQRFSSINCSFCINVCDERRRFTS